jgi:hypothetical protein
MRLRAVRSSTRRRPISVACTRSCTRRDLGQVPHRHMRSRRVHDRVQATEIGRRRVDDRTARSRIGQLELVGPRARIRRRIVAAIGHRDPAPPRQQLGADRPSQTARCTEHEGRARPLREVHRRIVGRQSSRALTSVRIWLMLSRRMSDTSSSVRGSVSTSNTTRSAASVISSISRS